VHLFATGTRKPLPFAPFFLSAAFFFFLFVFRSRVSHESLHRSSSRASDFFSLSLACPVAARAVRLSVRTQYAVGLCLVLLSLSARGSVRSEWGDFFPVSFCVSLETTFCLEVSWGNYRKTMYCMQASSETIDSSFVWESQNLWEELVDTNPIIHLSVLQVFLRFEDGWWTRTGPRH
jgi:hypothetical protein